MMLWVAWAPFLLSFWPCYVPPDAHPGIYSGWFYALCSQHMERTGVVAVDQSDLSHRPLHQHSWLPIGMAPPHPVGPQGDYLLLPLQHPHPLPASL